MATVQPLLFADGHDEEAVHSQQINLGPAMGRNPKDSITSPRKVLVPRLITRVKQEGFNSGEWINRAAACAFAQGAGNAGESQVFQLGFATRYYWNDVVGMKSRLLPFLGQSTVFATVSRPLDNLGLQSRRDVHAACVDLFARSYSRERNSATSTSPSASRRSATVRGVPES